MAYVLQATEKVRPSLGNQRHKNTKYAGNGLERCSGFLFFTVCLNILICWSITIIFLSKIILLIY